MDDRTRRPNIMLITFDDMVAFWRYKSIFGETLQTPNLDRICGQSTAFHAAYCQSPICSPSRASFMSGQTPHQSGMTLPKMDMFALVPPDRMWPHALKQAGYYTSSGGKIILGYVPLEDDVHAVLYCDKPKSFRIDWKVPREISTGLGGFRGGRATDDPKHDDRYYDFQSSRSAIRFLNAYQGDQPFYREVGFYGPHGPWITPRRFKDMYDDTRFVMPRTWQEGCVANAFFDKVSEQNFEDMPMEYWQRSVRNYFSAISHVDHHLGRVWDALKASRHADNTIVIIASDHGLHVGDRNRFRKHTLWEQVANVPLIVHTPDQQVGRVVTDPVALLDIGPTVMDFAGLPALQDCVGRSLRPLCQGAFDPQRAVLTVRGNNAAVRTGQYRFIRYEDGSTEMYDIVNDWWQTRNLGPDHPDHADCQAAHAACCAEYGLPLGSVTCAA